MKPLFEQPIFLNRNRVFRVYLGGKLFSEFFGDEPVDNNLPEEWVGSCVRALNKVQASPIEGLSVIEGTETTLLDFINDNKTQTLGDRDKFDVLCKMLDSGIRLAAQAHPDREYSLKHFNTTYGKAESWIILATREDACVFFGFKEKMTKEKLSEIVEKTADEKDIMEKYMNRIPVKPGDMFFVPAKMIHAIGAGCLLLEVQEPTDFTISIEHWCGDYELSESEMYLTVDKDAALDCFDYSLYGQEAINKALIVPKVLSDENGVVSEQLIGEEQTPCFSVVSHKINGGEKTLVSAPAMYIVLEGEGKIVGEVYSREVKKGSYFFLPYAASGKYSAVSDGYMQIVECLPPKK